MTASSSLHASDPAPVSQRPIAASDLPICALVFISVLHWSKGKTHRPKPYIILSASLPIDEPNKNKRYIRIYDIENGYIFNPTLNWVLTNTQCVIAP